MHPHTVQWTESLQHPALLAERMMCATRIQQGIALTDPVLTQAPQSFHQALQKAVSLGWMTQNETHISPTPQGMQHADAVAALFF
jgi:coproporphyrinogen III oxidase-like Fe-S oxidoreductase